MLAVPVEVAVTGVVSNVTVSTAASGWACAASGQDVHCAADSLAVGSSITITISGVVDSNHVGTLANTALLQHSTVDPDPVDNEATSESPVAQRADLSVTKSQPTPAVPIPGGPVSWQITAQQHGERQLGGSRSEPRQQHGFQDDGHRRFGRARRAEDALRRAWRGR